MDNNVTRRTSLDDYAINAIRNYTDTKQKTSNYLDSAIVQQTLGQSAKRPKTPLTHNTSAMSHWRGIVALDSPEHKNARIDNSTRIYTPMSVKSPVDDMKTSFDNYEAFKRDL